LRILG